jgi:hypothetical protein
MATQRETREYRRVGWKFPLQVTPAGGGARPLRVARGGVGLSRAGYGARRRDDAGVRLRHPRPRVRANTPGTIGFVAQQVRRALVTWEPRIDVLDIVVESPDSEPNLLLIKIGYRIRANNALANLVYPFYLREGT